MNEIEPSEISIFHKANTMRYSEPHELEQPGSLQRSRRKPFGPVLLGEGESYPRVPVEQDDLCL